MSLAKLSTKGQLIIPKALRSWPAGTAFAVARVGGGLQLMPVMAVPSVTVNAGYGILASRMKRLAKTDTGLTPRDEDAALLDAVRRDDEATQTHRPAQSRSRTTLNKRV
jgi:hypothetical protein